MKILKTLFLTALIMLLSGCAEKLEYQKAFASAMHRTVMICYSDDFWGDLESLNIKHLENSGNDVSFQPKIIEIEGVSKKCIQLDAPIPNQRELIWSEDKLSAEGHSTITLNSTKQNLTLKFDFRLTYPENKEMLGGSGMTVTAVNYGDDCIEREDHIYNNYAFYFDISDLIK